MDSSESPYPPLESLASTAAPNYPYFLPGLAPTGSLNLPNTYDRAASSESSTDDANDEFYGTDRVEDEDEDEDEDEGNDMNVKSVRSKAEGILNSDFKPVQLSENFPDIYRSLSDVPPLQSDHNGAHSVKRGRGRGSGRARGSAEFGEPGARSAREGRQRRIRGRPRGSRGTARGDGRRGGRKGKRGPRALVEPSDAFKVLQGKANEAWIEGNFDDAANLAMQAIQVNPEIFAAHSLLSRAYSAMGKEEESYGVLWSGAHTSRDAGVWREIVHRTIQLKGDKETEQNRLLYCYHQILKIDKDDYEARRSRLEVYKARDAYHKGIKECERLLKIRPHNLEVLDQLAALCMKDCQPNRAREAYEQSTNHYMLVQHDEIGGDYDFSDLNIYLDLFAAASQWSEGILEAKRVSRWLLGRQKESFWDEYQEDDREWDLEDHPRRIEVAEFVKEAFQYDTYGEGLPMEIRVKLGLFRLQLSPNIPEEAFRHLSFLDPTNETGANLVSTYPDLFREIADVLHTLGFYADAIQFLQPLSTVPEAADTKYFLLLADCYRASSSFKEAKECYEIAVGKDASNVEARIELARTYEELDESTQALEQIVEVIKLGRLDAVKRAKLRCGNGLPGVGTSPEKKKPNNSQRPAPRKKLLPKLTPSITQSSNMAGAKSILEPRKRLRRRRNMAMSIKYADSTTPLDEMGSANMENFVILFARLQELKPFVRAGKSEAISNWMHIADSMLSNFRAQAIFYPPERNIKFSGYDAESKRRASKLLTEAPEIEAMTERLRGINESSFRMFNNEMEASIPTDFRGIEFGQWLDIFCEYALYAASPPRMNSKLVQDVLEAVADANVFLHNPKFMLHIQVVSFTCALLLQDEEKLCNIARWFMKEYPFASDGYRIFAIVNRLHVSAGGLCSWYNSGPNQKFLMRQIKAMDEAALQARNQSSNSITEPRSIPEATSQVVSMLDPTLLVLYGHILATAGSYPNALNYYFRAYTMQPHNAMTVLSIAVAYVQYAIKRQAENRHYLIMQAVAFLRKYRELRLTPREDAATAGWLERMEVEFNEARLWHLLGLVHLAVPAYERCLELCEEAERERQALSAPGAVENGELEEVDFSREAAYSLQLILALGGDMKAAREVTQRWLSF